MAAIMQQLQAWVSASGILADKMAVIMIIALFGLMVVGLVLGQELAFVLGGAGVIIGWLAWGGPGVTIAMTKNLRPDAELLHGGNSHVRADGKLPDPFQGGRWPV